MIKDRDNASGKSLKNKDSSLKKEIEHLENLKQYIRNQKKNKKSNDEIINALVKVGWNKRIVEDVFRIEGYFERKQNNIIILFLIFTLIIILILLKKWLAKYIPQIITIVVVMSSFIVVHLILLKKKKNERKEEEKETEYLKPAKEEKINIDETIIRTEFDKLHELIEKKEKIKLNDIISEFKISKKLAEEWVLILEEEGLVKIHYSPFGDIEIRKWKKR